ATHHEYIAADFRVQAVGYPHPVRRKLVLTDTELTQPLGKRLFSKTGRRFCFQSCPLAQHVNVVYPVGYSGYKTGGKGGYEGRMVLMGSLLTVTAHFGAYGMLEIFLN
ncbi:hypothetical protein BaRGS_00031959, partial [Batillaria attramentaria]